MNGVMCAEPELIDLFFSEDEDEQNRAAVLCTGCHFQERCEKLGETEEFGVWGGTIQTKKPGTWNLSVEEDRKVCHKELHPWTPENIYSAGNFEFCLRCKEMRLEAARIKAEPLVKGKGTCPSGKHPWIVENVRILARGGSECKLCKKEVLSEKLSLRAKLTTKCSSKGHRCSMCGKFKDRSEFYKDLDNKTCGHRSNCKTCCSKRKLRRGK